MDFIDQFFASIKKAPRHSEEPRTSFPLLSLS